ncbi:putative nuclease HARBI1 [Periplaneta americana]|uniref:putative nuclease HARBI1 n=1 Tax=Periplaneta americana TaxID=6978 RepID=UPI0037E95832
MADVNNAFDVELLYLDHLNAVPNRGRALRRNDFENLREEEFLKRYRLSKTVVGKVVEEIQERLEYPTNRNIPLSPMQQILITLRFYATGSFHLMVGDNAGISKSTVSRIVSKVSAAIASMRRRYVTFPSVQERPSIVQQFYDMYNFPGIVGAIDCTHIKIQSPGGNRAEIYRNRKGYFSVNVQVISDANLLIRDIVARWPGSVHDSTIFSNSHIRAQFEMGAIDEGILLGDSGYPLRKYLLTSYLHPETRPQHNYNAAHIRTRNCVERMIGVWKRRFPVLSLGLRTKRQTTLTIIVATAVLHNIAVETRDQLPPEDLTLHQYITERRRNRHIRNQNLVPIHMENEQTAAAYRNAFAQQHFA